MYHGTMSLAWIFAVNNYKEKKKKDMDQDNKKGSPKKKDITSTEKAAPNRLHCESARVSAY